MQWTMPAGARPPRPREVVVCDRAFAADGSFLITSECQPPRRSMPTILPAPTRPMPEATD